MIQSACVVKAGCGKHVLGTSAASLAARNGVIWQLCEGYHGDVTGRLILGPQCCLTGTSTWPLARQAADAILEPSQLCHLCASNSAEPDDETSDRVVGCHHGRRIITPLPRTLARRGTSTRATTKPRRGRRRCGRRSAADRHQHRAVAGVARED
jgi:hypothetical protein